MLLDGIQGIRHHNIILCKADIWRGENGQEFPDEQRMIICYQCLMRLSSLKILHRLFDAEEFCCFIGIKWLNLSFLYDCHVLFLVYKSNLQQILGNLDSSS